MQVEKESKSVGLEKDALNQARWRVGFGETAIDDDDNGKVSS